MSSCQHATAGWLDDYMPALFVDATATDVPGTTAARFVAPRYTEDELVANPLLWNGLQENQTNLRCLLATMKGHHRLYLNYEGYTEEEQKQHAELGGKTNMVWNFFQDWKDTKDALAASGFCDSATTMTELAQYAPEAALGLLEYASPALRASATFVLMCLNTQRNAPVLTGRSDEPHGWHNVGATASRFMDAKMAASPAVIYAWHSMLDRLPDRYESRSSTRGSFDRSVFREYLPRIPVAHSSFEEVAVLDTA